MHYRNADGIVLVYDVTSGESFGFLQSVWLRGMVDIWDLEFKLHLREEDVVLAFVGNKTELPNHQVSKS
jgi:GTPase SAR1 family protein